MAEEPEVSSSVEEPWRPTNYFNYYTEVEEHFQRARGTSLFMMSTLDWALLEAWKNAGIPLEAVLRGIDLAFEQWRAKKKRGREVNSLTYCTQAVIEEAERMEGGKTGPAAETAAPFSIDELRNHLTEGSARVKASAAAGTGSVPAALDEILANLEENYAKLETLEQHLTALEDKMLALARSAMPDAELARARTELDSQLKPYRGKMTAPQLMMLEKQYLDRWLFERTGLPRLSLFYLR